MKNTHNEILDKLKIIHVRYSKEYKGNMEPYQMCYMWSVSSPPDIIEGTEPFYDMEKAFEISLDDDECIEIYDMNIEEAAIKIANIIARNANHSN